MRRSSSAPYPLHHRGPAACPTAGLSHVAVVEGLVALLLLPLVAYMLAARFRGGRRHTKVVRKRCTAQQQAPPDRAEVTEAEVGEEDEEDSIGTNVSEAGSSVDGEMEFSETGQPTITTDMTLARAVVASVTRQYAQAEAEKVQLQQSLLENNAIINKLLEREQAALKRVNEMEVGALVSEIKEKQQQHATPTLDHVRLLETELKHRDTLIDNLKVELARAQEHAVKESSERGSAFVQHTLMYESRIVHLEQELAKCKLRALREKETYNNALTALQQKNAALQAETAALEERWSAEEREKKRLMVTVRTQKQRLDSLQTALGSPRPLQQETSEPATVSPHGIANRSIGSPNVKVWSTPDTASPYGRQKENMRTHPAHRRSSTANSTPTNTKTSNGMPLGEVVSTTPTWHR